VLKREYIVKIVFLDETEYFKEEIVKKYAPIYTAYVFNEKEINFCCSMQEHYFLIPIFNIATKRRDEFEDEMLQYVGDEACYKTTKEIDSKISIEIETDESDPIEFINSDVDDVTEFSNWSELIDDAYLKFEKIKELD